MISLSLVLERIKLFSMPFGGSVTLGHSVPLMLISYKYGAFKGIITSLVFSIINMAFSFKVPPARSMQSFLILIILDYILPYLAIGAVSFFGKFFKKSSNKIYIETATSFILKILISSFSGATIWKEYIPFDSYIWIYSLIYNSLYLIPEYIITILILKEILKYLRHHFF